ncbi:uncharacterized protein G2W53_014746 [Senna tora]|uniref:Uncharacterized protein n=1 Tax=Senna tora TaxID=362788 RepID=A0A834WU37_9FABA|nr:uncharacterized protein G2W53_014746 [Senna tora]
MGFKICMIGKLYAKKFMMYRLLMKMLKKILSRLLDGMMILKRRKKT